MLGILILAQFYITTYYMETRIYQSQLTGELWYKVVPKLVS